MRLLYMRLKDRCSSILIGYFWKFEVRWPTFISLTSSKLTDVVLWSFVAVYQTRNLSSEVSWNKRMWGEDLRVCLRRFEPIRINSIPLIAS